MLTTFHCLLYICIPKQTFYELNNLWDRCGKNTLLLSYTVVGSHKVICYMWGLANVGL